MGKGLFEHVADTSAVTCSLGGDFASKSANKVSGVRSQSDMTLFAKITAAVSEV
ncbi:hypothetical protein [Paenibacillus planticolens]|uniref:hypothetical protein n=1 Tax=Paenibacillus planticolens TaxID=2654976 RepID=UPI001490CB47|nr:hypothetical protein [Paenibacillus planticolens]